MPKYKKEIFLLFLFFISVSFFIFAKISLAENPQIRIEWQTSIDNESDAVKKNSISHFELWRKKDEGEWEIRKNFLRYDYYYTYDEIEEDGVYQYRIKAVPKKSDSEVDFMQSPESSLIYCGEGICSDAEIEIESLAEEPATTGIEEIIPAAQELSAPLETVFIPEDSNETEDLDSVLLAGSARAEIFNNGSLVVAWGEVDEEITGEVEHFEVWRREVVDGQLQEWEEINSNISANQTGYVDSNPDEGTYDYYIKTVSNFGEETWLESARVTNNQDTTLSTFYGYNTENEDFILKWTIDPEEREEIDHIELWRQNLQDPQLEWEVVDGQNHLAADATRAEDVPDHDGFYVYGLHIVKKDGSVETETTSGLKDVKLCRPACEKICQSLSCKDIELNFCGGKSGIDNTCGGTITCAGENICGKENCGAFKSKSQCVENVCLGSCPTVYENKDSCVEDAGKMFDYYSGQPICVFEKDFVSVSKFSGGPQESNSFFGIYWDFDLSKEMEDKISRIEVFRRHNEEGEWEKLDIDIPIPYSTNLITDTPPGYGIYEYGIHIISKDGTFYGTETTSGFSPVRVAKLVNPTFKEGSICARKVENGQNLTIEALVPSNVQNASILINENISIPLNRNSNSQFIRQAEWIVPNDMELGHYPIQLIIDGEVGHWCYFEVFESSFRNGKPCNGNFMKGDPYDPMPVEANAPDNSQEVKATIDNHSIPLQKVPSFSGLWTTGWAIPGDLDGKEFNAELTVDGEAVDSCSFSVYTPQLESGCGGIYSLGETVLLEARAPNTPAEVKINIEGNFNNVISAIDPLDNYNPGLKRWSGIWTIPENMAPGTYSFNLVVSINEDSEVYHSCDFKVIEPFTESDLVLIFNHDKDLSSEPESENKLDIILVADMYSELQLEENEWPNYYYYNFSKQANEASQILTQDIAPFNELGYQNRINIWKINNTNTIGRYAINYYITQEEINKYMSDIPPEYKDEIVMIVNLDYRSWAIINEFATVSVWDVRFPYVFAHEFGHSFAGFYDEYLPTNSMGGAIEDDDSNVINCDDNPECSRWDSSEIDGCYGECSFANWYRTIDIGLMRTADARATRYGTMHENYIRNIFDTYYPVE